MNALEKIVDLLAAACLLFLLPLFFYGSGKRVCQTMLAGQAGEHFLNTISTSGEITLSVWMQLEHSMERFGCEAIDLQRERYVFEPGKEEGSVVERVYTNGREELLAEIQEEGGSRLRKGDRITLTLYVNEFPMVYSECIRTGANDG